MTIRKKDGCNGAMSSTRKMPKLQMAAEVSQPSINEEARTVELVWTTGAAVRRGSWDPYYEELSLESSDVRMDRLSSGSAPLLDSHESWDSSTVIGVVESASLSESEGIATVRFAKDDASEVVWQKVKDGILRNISVGYRVHRLELQEESIDETPIYRATDWEPIEISIVPIGADPKCQIREELEFNNCEFIAAEKRNMGQKDKTEKDEKKEVSADVARSEGKASERKRASQIRSAGQSLDLPEEFIKRHIESGTDIDAFRAQAMDEHANKNPIVSADTRAPDIVSGEDSRDKWLRGAENWIITRSSQASLLTKDAKSRGEKVDLDPGEFRGLTMVDLARSSLELSGVNTRGMSVMALVGKALTHRTGYNTTSDFSVLLENSLNKVLLSAYGTAPDDWTRFCAVGSVSDFRPHNRYRMGSFGALDSLDEHGEFKTKQISDGEKETISAGTKGNVIAISRQSVINDDMSAFSRLGVALGRAAKLSIEKDAYALLALNAGLGPAMSDGKTLFHPDHSNIGTGAAISVASIDSDRVVLKAQTDPSDNEILNLTPHILLIAAGLGGEARTINASEYDLDPSGSNKSSKPNTVRGLFSDIVDSARMSGTRRYLFADPSVAPTLEVVFLNGQQNPFLEVREGWSVDGTEYKVRLDYGVGAVDSRGAVTNAGA